MNRRSVIGSAIAASLAGVPAPGLATALQLRGDAGARLPDHADLWARLPLPFTPAEAWRLLTPETQAEIGAAVIGMHLAQYVFGDGQADADHFLDGDLREAACEVEHDILNRMDDRLWALFPDLYGPDGDHPRWALDGGMVLTLAEVAALPPPAEPVAPASAPKPDPIYALIEAADAARRAHQGIFDDGLDEDDPAQMARLDALRDADGAAFQALAEVIPTTNDGDVALADFYLRVLDDPDGMATAHLRHLRDVLAGGVS